MNEITFTEDDGYVPTQDEARKWASRMIACKQFDWDTIAELADPDGRVLSQPGCDVVNEALYSCSVTFTWSDGQIITFAEEDR